MDSDTELAKSRVYTIKDGTLVLSDPPAEAVRLSHAQPNTIIDTKYQILDLVGEGGMGAVYRTRHLLLNKEVALKTFKSASLTQEDRKRFHREAQAIAKLTHINIIQIFDFGLTEKGVPYYTMDFLTGESMAERIKENGPLTVEEAAAFFSQVCEGLALAHAKGIVHRDLKPANLFIEKPAPGKGNSETIKIVDFGIATAGDASAMADKITLRGVIFGSPLYMSPEQAAGDTISALSDVYSLGCSLFEALTGKPPFKGKSPLDTIVMHRNTKPPSLEDTAPGKIFPFTLERLVAKMMAKDPEDRPQSMTQVAAELKQFLPRSARPSKPSLTVIEKPQPSAGQLDATKAAEPEGGVRENMKATNTRAIVIVAVLCCLSITAVAYFSLSKHVSERASNASGNKVSAMVAAAKPSSKKNTSVPERPAYAKVLVTRKVETDTSGKNVVSFTFPGDQYYGRFAQLLNHNINTAATGKVKWIVGDEPIFMPSEDFLNDSDNLGVFQADDLDGIDLRLCQGYACDAKFMRQVGRLTGLKYLNLSNTDVADEVLPEVFKLKHLKILALDSTGITGGALFKLPQLKQLECIGFMHCKEAGKVLAGLKGGMCKTLYVAYDPLTITDFKNIATLSHLKLLALNGTNANDDALTTISTLTELKDLSLQHSNLTAAAVKPLTTLIQRGLVDLDISESNIPMASAREIKQIMPQAKIPRDHTYDPDWSELGNHPVAQ